MEDVIVLVSKEYAEDKKRNYFEFYTFYNVTKGKYFYTQSLHNDFKYISVIYIVLHIGYYHFDKAGICNSNIRGFYNFNDLKELLDKIGSNFKDFNSYRKMVDHLDYEIGKQKYMGRSKLSHEEVISLVSDNRALKLIE